MNKLNELRIINDANIIYLKKINKNYKRNEIIKNILNNETCFFKMSKEDAYMILQEIGILDDQIDTVYKNLISFDEFYKLYKNKAIDINDKELVIKYQIYEINAISKKQRLEI